MDPPAGATVLESLLAVPEIAKTLVPRWARWGLFRELRDLRQTCHGFGYAIITPFDVTEAAIYHTRRYLRDKPSYEGDSDTVAARNQLCIAISQLGAVIAGYFKAGLVRGYESESKTNLKYRISDIGDLFGWIPGRLDALIRNARSFEHEHHFMMECRDLRFADVILISVSEAVNSLTPITLPPCFTVRGLNEHAEFEDMIGELKHAFGQMNDVAMEVRVCNAIGPAYTMPKGWSDSLNPLIPKYPTWLEGCNRMASALDTFYRYLHADFKDRALWLRLFSPIDAKDYIGWLGLTRGQYVKTVLAPICSMVEQFPIRKLWLQNMRDSFRRGEETFVRLRIEGAPDPPFRTLTGVINSYKKYQSYVSGGVEVRSGEYPIPSTRIEYMKYLQTRVQEAVSGQEGLWERRTNEGRTRAVLDKTGELIHTDERATRYYIPYAPRAGAGKPVAVSSACFANLLAKEDSGSSIPALTYMIWTSSTAALARSYRTNGTYCWSEEKFTQSYSPLEAQICCEFCTETGIGKRPVLIGRKAALYSFLEFIGMVDNRHFYVSDFPTGLGFIEFGSYPVRELEQLTNADNTILVEMVRNPNNDLVLVEQRMTEDELATFKVLVGGPEGALAEAYKLPRVGTTVRELRFVFPKQQRRLEEFAWGYQQQCRADLTSVFTNGYTPGHAVRTTDMFTAYISEWTADLVTTPIGLWSIARKRCYPTTDTAEYIAQAKADGQYSLKENRPEDTEHTVWRRYGHPILPLPSFKNTKLVIECKVLLSH